MKKPLPTIGLAAMSVVFAAACIMVMDPENKASWEPRGEFRKTVEFRAGGTLSLENDIGDVEISGWDKDSVEVVAQGAGGEPGKKRKVRAYGFWELKPDIEIETTESGLAIRTRPFDGPGDFTAVDCMIRVPHSVILRRVRIREGNLAVSDVFGSLEASLDKGDLSVSNFSGSVDASLGEGAADVEILDLREDDAIGISSRQGDIILRLEPGTSARVEAEAPRGEVRSEFDLDVETPAASVKGRIGEGGASITLKAANGRIEILAVKDTIGRSLNGKAN